MLKNYMEEFVDQHLPNIFLESPEEYADICQCPECMLRMKAEALNNLPPFYVTCKVGEVYGEYASTKELQKKVNMLAVIAKAIMAVHKTAHKEQEQQD